MTSGYGWSPPRFLRTTTWLPGKGELPKAIVERAASLAAWYSKSRNAKSVGVDYCKASQVSKPRGAPAGLVELADHKTIRVKPAAFEGAGD